jgi:hypothetical protein
VSQVPDERGPWAPRAAGADEGEPIADILRDLGERLRSNGPIAEGDDAYAVQWRVLRRAARDRGRLFEHEPDDWLSARGGSEHVCRFVAESHRFEKLTKEDLAGWYVDLDVRRLVPATPLQYLTRLDLHNEVFADDIRFVGVEIPPARPFSSRILTSQPHIEGDAPALVDLEAWLAALQFERVADLQVGASDARCYRQGDLWLFDVRPMNFVHNGDDIIPIDVIVQRMA